MFGAPPKTASGFTLPPTTPATTATSTDLFGNLAQQPGAGDNKSASTLFSTPVKPTTTAPAPSTGVGGSSFGGLAKTSANLSFVAPQTTQTSLGGFGFGGTTIPVLGNTAATSAVPATTSATAAPSLQFSFGGVAATTAAAPISASTTSFTPILGGVSTTTAASGTAASTGLLFGTPTAPTSAPSVPKIGLSTTTATTTTAQATTGFSLGCTTSIASVAPTQTTTTPSIPVTGSSLTFAQLEDSINKWTIDLEEQGKFFVNQAKQLNAWDTLLISNGDKILNLNSSIKKVKQQQSQLDQELDFILAQQKELEELIVPLEKELVDIPVSDIDRNQMYQFAEVIDSQLKQILDDLKEIIENINESNRDEEVVANPITQISKILNAHMGSLEWIDTNTAQISRQLAELSKIEEASKKNLSLNNSSTSMFM